MITSEQTKSPHEVALQSICELVECNYHAPHRMGTGLFVTPNRYATLNNDFDGALLVANKTELVQQLSPLLILSAFEHPDERLLTDDELWSLLRFLMLSNVLVSDINMDRYPRHSGRLRMLMQSASR